MARILRVAKRQWRQYGGLPKKLIVSDWDTEKAETTDEWQSESASSSRSSSGSYDSQDAILGSKSRPRGPAKAYENERIPRRKCNIYFTVVVGLALITFVVTLHQLHIASQNAVSRGIDRPTQKQPWDEFEVLTRYFGGVRSLQRREDIEPEFPGDRTKILEAFRNASSSDIHRASAVEKRGEVRSSQPFHPIDSLDHRCPLVSDNHIYPPDVRIYDGAPKGFPDAAIGSYELLGLRQDVCYDRFGRLGPYGLGYSKRRGGTGAGLEGDREGAEEVWKTSSMVNYEQISWSIAQSECIQSRESSSANNNSSTRSALLIRTWNDYEYDPEDVLHLRAMINELALNSDCDMQVHFLIHVKDDDAALWSDEATYQNTLQASLPEEFRGMGTLWSERQMSLIYGGLDESVLDNIATHGNSRSTFMPVQYFSQQHPEYDFIWNWEIDVRYTGQFRELIDRVGDWTSRQPRKELWERNGRFFVPAEHGSWEDFKQMVRVQSEHGTSSKSNIFASFGIDESAPGTHVPAERPIWGPERPEWDEIVETLNGDLPTAPPVASDKDKYEWGVGEAADLVTFSPIFDPAGTSFPPATDLTGYNVTHYQSPPLRASIGTTMRLSRRLLSTMHRETALKRHTMASELWPSSVSLHHGYKAVYAPVPVYVERQWPVDYLAAVLNGGRNGASGGSRTSVFSVDRRRGGATEEDGLRTALAGTTWHNHGKFAARLWRRWLGYKADGEGGEEHERAKEGRMCLPAMLLHPVKDVKLIYEDRG